MKRPMSRRKMLAMMAALAGGAGLVGVQRLLTGGGSQALSAGMTPQAYLPLVRGSAPTATPTATLTPTATATATRTPTSSRTATGTAMKTSTPAATPTHSQTPGVPPVLRGRVVHTHSVNATSWAGQTDYWNYVNQNVVNNMVDQGVMAFTGTTTVADAWRTLLPNYRAGQKIAIKASFNNSASCSDSDGQIDALIQPINSVVRGLKQIGVSEGDLWIVDPSRSIPQHFVNACQYPGVHYFDPGCRESATWESNDPNASLEFFPPPGVARPPATRVSDVLINATYLINMPIMKAHGIAGISLAFKNHFGSISQPWNLHSYLGSSGRANYNPLVDIYRNPHVGGKTILTISDSLFAAKMFDVRPTTWTTFGGAVPNSLFFATDPVAIDCVMCDFLAAEISLDAMSDTYLKLAEQANLGVYERGNPWGGGYSRINYYKLTL